jgi:hypothetical protein
LAPDEPRRDAPLRLPWVSALPAMRRNGPRAGPSPTLDVSGAPERVTGTGPRRGLHPSPY